MMYRLFYWFQRVDPTRVGGPWWYRDFLSSQGRASFLA